MGAGVVVMTVLTLRSRGFDLRVHRWVLFRNGREAAAKFLDGAPGQPAWDWEAYKRSYRSSQAPAISAAARQ